VLRARRPGPPSALARDRQGGHPLRHADVQHTPDGEGVRRADIRAGHAAGRRPLGRPGAGCPERAGGRRARRPRRRSCRIDPMSRKSVARSRCALCGAKDVSEPRGEEKYCRDCWDKKIAVEEIVAREFALKRYIRAHSAEKYLVYHSTIKRPCGQLIVVDDGYDLFLTLILYPTFAWDEP